MRCFFVFVILYSEEENLTFSWSVPYKYFYYFCFSSSSSRHHSVRRGTRVFFAWVNSRLQTSLGTWVHSFCGFKLGISFVTNLQVFIGCRSHVSSGISTRDSTSWSKHSSSAFFIRQPLPHTGNGIFSHLVLAAPASKLLFLRLWSKKNSKSEQSCLLKMNANSPELSEEDSWTTKWEKM